MVTRPKPKPAIKPVKAWGLLKPNGRLWAWAVIPKARADDVRCYEGERVVRVLITVIPE